MSPATKLLPKASLAAWAASLAPREIHAPVLRDGAWDLGPLADPADLRLDFPQTAHAPKKLVFRQREVLLEFDTAADGTPRVKERLPEPAPAVVFGVRPCDARALLLTDRVFGEPFPDPGYRARREAVALVGLACVSPPSPHCFCPSVGGSPHDAAGLDVLMTDLGEEWAVEAFTARGRGLLEAAPRLFRDLTEAERHRRDHLHRGAERLIRRRVERLPAVTERLEGMFDSPFWREAAAACIRCGICTYLCPACHCFDISDEVDSALPVRGRRVRTWDTCQFPDFTMHSSGHNPRPDKASRLRQRVLHKFLYFVRTHGEYQCTGCGRCISLCPAGIDLLDILNRVGAHGC